MKLLLSGAFVFNKNGFDRGDLLISDPASDAPDARIDFSGKYIFPGFTDVHAHLREPGFSYKETVATGSVAAARGGFTTVCTMPNLSPSPDGRAGFDAILEPIRESAKVRVLPYGAITKGGLGFELADFEDMPDALAFTDDGRGTTTDILCKALERASLMGKIICSHCEDTSLKGGDHIAASSPIARTLGIAGITNESEYIQLERELKAVEQTGGSYHVCHISCRQSVELIRRAKARGLDVTCETAPHYFALDYTDIKSDDGRFKMNPPLRSPADREAIIKGLADGTIDMIATDHAPHSAEEKGRGLAGSAMGVVGLETAFAASYTALVRPGIISLHRLVELMSTAPSRRFGIPKNDADITVFDLERGYIVNPDDFASLGKSTPFEGSELYGECLLTVVGGKIVYRRQDI